jgi:hypothetical protein
MEPRIFFTTREILTMFGKAAVATTLPDGSVRIEKAGCVGVGPTVAAAGLDWRHKFTDRMCRPKPTGP